MTYLDERTEFNFVLTQTLPTTGMCKYELYQYDTHVLSNEALMFTGNFYYDGRTTVTLDLTDIIRSLSDMPSSEKFTDGGVYDALNTKLVARYKVKAYFSTGTVDSGWKIVSMIYRYPNYRTTNNFSNGASIFWDIYNVTTGTTVALQGYENRYELALTPHYPFKRTDVYKYAQAFVNGSSVQQIDLSVEGGSYGEDVYVETAQGTQGTAYIAPIEEMFVWENTELLHGYNPHILMNNDTEIAIFDTCYKRYYLFWRDRFGGYQSQAFNDILQYSESFNVTETQNYKNERKKSFIQVQPKWKINSGWINEVVYPLYESIFVSPFLLLYDSYEDKLYNVIVNGDYTEKTYKNEKRLLNLNLELEGISKQEIIY